MSLTRLLFLSALLATACGGPAEQTSLSESCGLSAGTLDQFIPFASGSYEKGKDQKKVLKLVEKPRDPPCSNPQKAP